MLHLFAATVVAEAQAPTEVEPARLAAARLTASFNGDLLLDRAANHAGAGYPLFVRNAVDDGTSRLVGNLLLHRAGVSLCLDLRLANFDLTPDGYLFADALHAADRFLFPNRARNPDFNGLGAHDTRLTVVLAAVLAMETLP